ncbi:MAG: hypothetical protein KatS3mg124_1238 [Porticoccaceae bacterium]|nr:MAG: hypothetical protein KatS3mg124_1238 [Porticoccaceae bacterium]
MIAKQATLGKPRAVLERVIDASADHPNLRRLLVAAAVALGYLGAGELALTLAVGPAAAAPFWPAAGLAAGGVFLWGRPALAGTFAGALALYLDLWVTPERADGPVLAVLLAAAITLQAGAVAWLARRFASRDEEGSPRLSAWFPLTIAPLGCLTAPTLALAVLWAFGRVEAAALPESFTFWWAGDALGAMIGVPLLAALFGGGRGKRQPAVAAAMALLLVAVAAVFFYHRERERELAGQTFAARLEAAKQALAAALERGLDALYSLERFFESSVEVSAAEFDHFAASLYARNPHVQALEWIPRVPAAVRADFEAQIAPIRAWTPGDRLVPAPARPYHFAVAYVAPRAGNERALGYDVASQPLAHRALSRALQTGEPAATAPIRLIQETGDQAGTVVYLSVERGGQVLGVVALVIRLGDFLSGVGAGLPGGLADLHLRVRDGADLLWEGGAPAAPGGPRARHRLDFAGRSWTLEWAAAAALASGGGSGGWLLAGMLAFVASFSGWILALAERNRAIAREVDERTRELRREIAERTAAERDLRVLFRAIEASPVMVLVADAEGRIRYANPALLAATEARAADLVGTAASEVLGVDPARLARTGEFRGELRLRRPAGGPLWVQAAVARVAGAEEGGDDYVVVLQDVTEERNLRQQIVYQARHDPLTGLANRYEFERHLERLVREARESGSRHALGYCDLDQFKLVNDTAGHVAGDALLKRVADELRASFRRGDLVARLGGDEFGVLMENCGLAEALAVAEKARRRIEALRFDWGGETYRVAMSVGVAAIDGQVAGAQEVLRRADAACYAAKEAGRNRVLAYSAEDAHLARLQGGFTWSLRLREALDGAGLALFGRPLLPLADGAPPRLWVEPRLWHEGAWLGPDALRAAAERSGLAARLDRWVLGELARWLEGEDACGIDRFVVSLSPAAAADGELSAWLEACADGRPELAARLLLAVGEAALAELARPAHSFREVLSRGGWRLAVEPAAVTPELFAALAALPVDSLAIPGLGSATLAEPVACTLVEAWVRAAHLAGAKVAVVGVTERRCAEVLRRLGVDYWEGEAAASPSPLAEAVAAAGGAGPTLARDA